MIPPCPNCGSECEEFPGNEDHKPAVECVTCEYSMPAHGIDQAIANHERLAGMCEWVLSKDNDLTTDCGAKTNEELARMLVLKAGSEFCFSCGKKVKVKE